MASIDIRSLQLADIPFGMSVCAQAGWNQMEFDWRRTLEYAPEGCFLASMQGQPAGTVTTTPYGTELAWIGMMLVDINFRRCGVATQLMAKSMQTLQDAGMECIKLDATPDGYKVYCQLGFHSEWNMQRWERVASSDPSPASAPTGAASDDSPASIQATAQPDRGGDPWDAAEFAGMDRAAFGADRQTWLSRLAGDSQVVSLESGFGMLRPGRLASYLGPLVARDLSTAEQIVTRLLEPRTAAAAARIFWDIPGDNPPAHHLARRFGFQPVRELIRMAWGRQRTAERPQWLYALADPSSG